MERAMSKERFSKKRFSPVKSIRTRAEQFEVCVTTFKSWMKDPEFPTDELLQIGGFADQPRLGLTDRGAERWQQVLLERAKQPRRVSPNLANPKAAAARSVEIRRAKAAARRVEQANSVVTTTVKPVTESVSTRP
jgi:hypothetical protein